MLYFLVVREQTIISVKYFTKCFYSPNIFRFDKHRFWVRWTLSHMIKPYKVYLVVRWIFVLYVLLFAEVMGAIQRNVANYLLCLLSDYLRILPCKVELFVKDGHDCRHLWKTKMIENHFQTIVKSVSFINRMNFPLSSFWTGSA